MKPIVIAIVVALGLAGCGSGAATKAGPKENSEVFTACSLAGEKECSKKAQEAEKPATPAEKAASEAGFRAYAACKAAEESACIRKGAEAEASKQAAQLEVAKEAGEAEAEAEARHPEPTSKAIQESASTAAEQANAAHPEWYGRKSAVEEENNATRKSAEEQCGQHLSDGQVEQVADGGGCPR